MNAISPFMPESYHMFQPFFQIPHNSKITKSGKLITQLHLHFLSN